jgi:hypothetical protein
MIERGHGSSLIVSVFSEMVALTGTPVRRSGKPVTFDAHIVASTVSPILPADSMMTNAGIAVSFRAESESKRSYHFPAADATCVLCLVKSKLLLCGAT